LRNYCGEPPAHPVVKQLIERLPEGNPRLDQLDICLTNTGVVSDEFGFVEAYRAKKTEIAAWLDDPSERVRGFAAAFLRRIDQRIASEQRRAEQRKELRDRDFGDPDT